MLKGVNTNNEITKLKRTGISRYLFNGAIKNHKETKPRALIQNRNILI